MSAEPSLTLRASGPDFRLAEHREALQHYLSSQTEAKAYLARVSEDGTAIVTLTGSSAPRTSQSLAQKHHNLKGHTLYFSPALSYDRAPDESRPRHAAGLGRGRGRGAVGVKGNWRGEKIFPIGRGAARKETENGRTLTHRGSTSTTSGGYSSLSDFVPDAHWSESSSYHSLPCLGFADGNVEREIDLPSNVDADGCADTSLSLDTCSLHGPPYPSETCIRFFGLPLDADPVKVEAMVKKEASQGKSAGVTVKFISSEKADDGSLTARLQLSDAKGVFTLWKKRHLRKMMYERSPITFDIEYEESYEEDRFLIENVPRDGPCLDATRAALKMHLESVDVLNDKSILGLCFVDSERNGVVAFLDDFVVDDDLVKELNSNGQHFERKDDEFVQLQFSLIPKPRTVMVTASGIGSTINKGMIRNYFHIQLASLSGSPLFVEEISTNEADRAIVKLRRISDAEAVLKISELPLISNSHVTIVQHSHLPTSFTAADLPSEEAQVPEPEISDFELVFSPPRIDKHIINFILSDPNTRWYRSLQQVGLFKWDPETETIAFTCSSASVNVSESEWKSSTENKFDDLYFQFSIRRLEISEDENLWTKTLTMAENENKLRGDPIRLIPRPQENTIRFVGEKHIAEDIHMHCASTLSAWVYEKKKNEEEITDTLRCPTDDHLTLLKSTPQYKSLEDSLGVKDDSTPGHITITGPAYLVRGGKESMKDVLDSMREKSLSKRYSHLTEFFLSDVGFSQLSNALFEASVPAVVLRHRDDDDCEDVERRSVRVLTFAEDFDTVTQLIADTFQTRHIRRRDENTSRYLRSSDASEFLKQLCSELSVVSSFAGGEIVLTGPIGSVSKAHDDYSQFLLENVIYERKCKVRGNYAFQYLKKFCQKRIDSIVSRLKSHRAEISFRRSGKRHYVVRRVTRNGREAVDAEITKLLRTLHYAQDEFKKHGLDKYLKTDGFQQTKEIIQGKNDVMLFFGDEWEDDGEAEEEWEDEEGGEVEEEEETLPFDSSSVSLGSFVRNKDSHSLRIGLFKGDLCKHQVDSIVNAANEDLNHIGGLAGYILECAGHRIQAESKDILSTMSGRRLPTGKAVATSAGRLTTTKHIIHAVGPRWPYGKSRFSEEVAVTRNLLRDAVCSCLDVASGLKLKSIAFPAISTGIFGCPSDVVAENMVKGVDAFFAANPTSSVRRVDFIMRSSDEDNIRCFGDELKRKFGPAPPVHRPYRPKPAIRPRRVAEKVSSEVVPVRERASVRSKQFEVVVRSGDITAEKVDAIVNSTNKGLDLDSGMASKAISRAAGPGLQRECSQIVGNKGSLKPGYVYVTSGCNLPSSHVFHLLCPNSSKDLPAAVIRCLKKADKRNLSSIAFPALGTGNLGIADDEAADALFSGIAKFRTGNPKSSVKSVSVVIFDKTKLQAFQTMRRKYFVSESAESSAALDRFVQSASLPMEDPPTITTDEATLSNGCRIKIEMGNVVADTTDAIVASQGVVLTSVLQADLTLQQSLKTKSGGKLSDVVELPATQLNCQSVYVIGPTSYNNGMSDAANAQNISSVVEKCLTMADAAGLSSISIPTIGTGKLGYSNLLSCSAILDAAKAYASQHLYPSLSLIKISVFDAPRVRDFEKELQRQFPTASKPSALRRFWGGVKSAFGYGDNKAAATVPTLKARKKVANYSAKEPDSVSVMIVGNSDEACGTALANLKRAIFDNCIKRQFKGELPKEVDAKTLEKVAAERGVALSIDDKGEKTCIFLEGQVNDVHEGLIQLGTVLSEMIKQEHEEFETEAICSKLTWTWEDDKKVPVAYGRKDILKIEEAFQNEETSLKLTIGGNDYVLDLKAMTQASLSTKTVRKISRQIIETIGTGSGVSAVPASWTCRTVSAGVQRVKLNSQSPEYDQVSKAFTSTLAKYPARIVYIERVENATLYAKYVQEKGTLAEKRKTEIANGTATLEHRLFHGTSSDSVEHIITNGFNRSFAGTAAGKAFGVGVYFGNLSSTSHHYTKVNRNGHRTMFYCYVLMGLTTVGTPAMIEPPVIQLATSVVDRYDSTVNSTSNPTIFVSCYRDNMAYPAYIITFK